jgi:hypothetical protein
MPKTKKSKYSDDRPMITPTAISLGVTSSSVWALANETELSMPGADSAAEPWLTISLAPEYWVNGHGWAMAPFYTRAAPFGAAKGTGKP